MNFENLDSAYVFSVLRSQPSPSSSSFCSSSTSSCFSCSSARKLFEFSSSITVMPTRSKRPLSKKRPSRRTSSKISMKMPLKPRVTKSQLKKKDKKDEKWQQIKQEKAACFIIIIINIYYLSTFSQINSSI